jgi:tetraacyldisaccharide 4'-kinase
MSVWNVVRIILFPFALLYDAITRLRNHLFNIGYKPSFQFEVPVIGVGNLSVGGTGKTPMVEYLIRLLKDSKEVATLSRGYGRKTTGLRFADDKDTAATIGDEPYQFYLKFKGSIHINVAEDRAFAIPSILHQYPSTEVILMDDGFQHRTVKPQFSVLLSDYSNPFYTDFVIPFGRLREARKEAKRADVVVVTKCPQAENSIDFDGIEEKVKRYAGDKPVFFSAIKYGVPQGFGKVSEFTQKVILVTGIANATPLVEYVKANFCLLETIPFPDHHFYTASDLQKISETKKRAGIGVCLLTTEKDRVKLIQAPLKNLVLAEEWFYLPIETYFLKDGDKFDKMILNSIDKPATSSLLID